VQDSQFWTLPKEQSATVIAAALGLVKLLAAMLAPYMPATASAIHGMLQAGPEWGTLGQHFMDDAAQLHNAVPAGHKLAKPALLFSEISEDTVAQLQRQFSGSQAAQTATAGGVAGATGGGSSGGGGPGGGGGKVCHLAVFLFAFSFELSCPTCTLRASPVDVKRWYDINRHTAGVHCFCKLGLTGAEVNVDVSECLHTRAV
jgi:hypothetical protein